MIEDQYKSSWYIPNSLLLDLRLHLFAGRRRGERLKATEVAEEAIRDLLEAGGLEAFRERADSLLDNYEGERIVAVRVALPYDTVAEIRRQALIEDQHGHWWSTGKVLPPYAPVDGRGRARGARSPPRRPPSRHRAGVVGPQRRRLRASD